ncbi:hypothetical protein HYH03_001206 [Edaphochlamys debaryana]|uniref:SAM domain-containing protein n=1 Tax=Edaphochlamys debaryana TaxID=47281 RepID=A0A835YEX0_9CHLO|nr:hypothetical protein HYH03_001206 [Edaphochlamys debaryana]|eukprot:KAG2501423.1 hypothetical protein HYH03_001206 [Edaphochlamys debaryana]
MATVVSAPLAAVVPAPAAAGAGGATASGSAAGCSARRYTHGDTLRFNLPTCRPGPGWVSYIGRHVSGPAGPGPASATAASQPDTSKGAFVLAAAAAVADRGGTEPGPDGRAVAAPPPANVEEAQGRGGAAQETAAKIRKDTLPGDEAEVTLEAMSMRCFSWLDEETHMFGQINIFGAPILRDSKERPEEPGHWEKPYKYPWPQITGDHLHENVSLRREMDPVAPETFRKYGDSKGAVAAAYLIAAGADGAVNSYLGLPGASDEAKAQVPEGSLTPGGQPFILEAFIKDGAGGRRAVMPAYDVASGDLIAWVQIREQVTFQDPHTPHVLTVLSPSVPPLRGYLPPAASAWLPEEVPRKGEGAVTRVGEGGWAETEEGLEAEWVPPETDGLPPGHTLLRLPDEGYLICPTNINKSPGGPALFELGAVVRSAEGAPRGALAGSGPVVGLRRVATRFGAEGLLAEIPAIWPATRGLPDFPPIAVRSSADPWLSYVYVTGCSGYLDAQKRIASLGTQLATEAAARQRLQEDLDSERRRAASAMQNASLLMQQLRTASSASASASAAAAAASVSASAAAASAPLPSIPSDGAGWAPANGLILDVSGGGRSGSSGGVDSQGAPESPFRRTPAMDSVADAEVAVSGAHGRRGPRPPSRVVPLDVPAPADGAAGAVAGTGAAAAVGARVAHVVIGAQGGGGGGGDGGSAMATPLPVRNTSGPALSTASPLGIRAVLGLPSSPAALALADTTAGATARATAGSGSGTGARVGAGAVQPHQRLPCYSLDQLFSDLGLLPYLPRFQEEAIRLDMLLAMDVPQMEQLGLRPLGYCIRVREAVVDLARGLLRACEEAAVLVQLQAPATLPAPAPATALAPGRTPPPAHGHRGAGEDRSTQVVAAPAVAQGGELGQEAERREGGPGLERRRQLGAELEAVGAGLIQP